MFTDRIQKLAKEHNITIAQMLKDLGLGQGTFATWKKRGTIPNGETLFNLAAYFNVTVEYLLGKSEERTAGTKTGLTPKEYKIIKAYRAKPEMQAAVDTLLGVESGTDVSEDVAQLG